MAKEEPDALLDAPRHGKAKGPLQEAPHLGIGLDPGKEGLELWRGRGRVIDHRHALGQQIGPVMRIKPQLGHR
jgi:hypothetical protein